MADNQSVRDIFDQMWLRERRLLIDLIDERFRSIAAGMGVDVGDPEITLGDTAGAGVSHRTIRSDARIVAFDNSMPTRIRPLTEGDTGDSNYAARADHSHGGEFDATPGFPNSTEVGTSFTITAGSTEAAVETEYEIAVA